MLWAQNFLSRDYRYNSEQIMSFQLMKNVSVFTYSEFLPSSAPSDTNIEGLHILETPQSVTVENGKMIILTRSPKYVVISAQDKNVTCYGVVTQLHHAKTVINIIGGLFPASVDKSMYIFKSHTLIDFSGFQEAASVNMREELAKIIAEKKF